MKQIWIKLCAALLALSLVSCAPQETKHFSREVFALDTISTFTIFGMNEAQANEQLKIAEDWILYYDALLSRTAVGSDVYRANEAGGAPILIKAETAALIERALVYSVDSEGSFDITILPLKELWDFKSEHPRLPSEQEIEAARALVDYRNVEIGSERVIAVNEELVRAPGESPGAEQTMRTLTLHDGAQIDLGAIAKGYIADRIAQELTQGGVTSAIINLGGNVRTIGEKSDGVPWSIGIQDPDGVQNNYMATVKLRDGSVVTSGVYERHFVLDGVRYHHLLDPFTGYPSEKGLLSVTILSEDSLSGDAMSTACFVLGPEKGMLLVERTAGVEAVFVLENGELITSSGMDRYQFSIKDEG